MNNDSNSAGKCPFDHSSKGPTSEPTHTPDRIKKLPVLRGFHVPFFVCTLPDGSRDFRMADPAKLKRCIIMNLCWVCGEPMGRNKSFVIGPMCSITRTSAEPPSHHECAIYSVKVCPFMARPHMKRRDHEAVKDMGSVAPGEMIERNPGVSAVWTTPSYTTFNDGNGGTLIRIGDPEKVEWWREGREATRAEVLQSITDGLPSLRAMCDSGATQEDRDADHRQLDAMLVHASQYLPSFAPLNTSPRSRLSIPPLVRASQCLPPVI